MMIQVGAEESNSPESKKAKRVFDLDNESTARIFCFLHSIDVLNVECVNKRFQNVAKMYWKQKVHFDWRNEVESINDKRKRAMATVKICSRIGDILKTIILSVFEIDWKHNEFLSIGQLCPNISSITFGYDHYDTELCSPEILFNSFHSLKQLHFCRDEYGTYNTRLSLLQLNSIPKSIEILIGVSGDRKSPIFKNSDDFCNFFTNHQNLVETKAEYLNVSGNELAIIFPVIASHCPRLKKIGLWFCSCTFNGIELLEGMKELDLYNSDISDNEMIAFCNQNAEMEILKTNQNFGIRAIESIVELKKLRGLDAQAWNSYEISSDEKQRIIQKIFINSGASLTWLCLPEWYLTTQTIEIMADLCPVLRYICMFFLPECVNPEVIRYLIDKIVERPEWKNGIDELELCVYVNCGNNDEGDEEFASFEALKSKDASFPVGVTLDINRYESD